MSTKPSSGKGDVRTAGAVKPGRYDAIGGSRGVGSGLSWGSVDSDAVFEAVRCITNLGDAIMFSVTSDGGALVIQVYSGPTKPRWYFPRVEEAETHLRLLAAQASKLEQP